MSSDVGSDATVYLVDDDDGVRESLLLLLELKGFRAIGFPSAEAFLAAVLPDAPGCLLLDLRMPGMTGLELQAALAERAVKWPIVVISAHGDVAAARAAFKAGAIDFLEKPIEESALLRALASALAQDRQHRADSAVAADWRRRMARLSTREREVMWLVADGHGNREIASRLGLSPRTVEIYKARMLEKLELRGLADLLRAVQHLPR